MLLCISYKKDRGHLMRRKHRSRLDYNEYVLSESEEVTLQINKKVIGFDNIMLMHSHCASLIYAQDICRATWPAADHAPRWPKIVWVTSASNHTFNETSQRWLIVPSFPTSKPVLFPFRELGKTDQEPKKISNDWKTPSQGVNVRGKGLTCKRASDLLRALYPKDHHGQAGYRRQRMEIQRGDGDTCQRFTDCFGPYGTVK